MGKATQDLRDEHTAILKGLHLLETMLISEKQSAEKKLEDYNEVLHFLKSFADKCHHGKEENFLFEKLVELGMQKEGGPVGAMLYEHDQGRSLIAAMVSSLEKQDAATFSQAAGEYIRLLRAHIDKENNVLFVMADRLINPQVQEELFALFEQFEEEVLGYGIHDELHSMMNQWEQDYA